MIVSEHDLDQAVLDVEVAVGRQPADLVLRACQLVNVTSNEIYTASIAIRDGRIVAIRPDYAGPARKVIDCDGLYAVPGLVDFSDQDKQCDFVTTSVRSSASAPPLPGSLVTSWETLMRQSGERTLAAPIHPIGLCADFDEMLSLLRDGTTPFLDMASLADPAALFAEIRGRAVSPARLRFANLAAAGNARLGEAARAALAAGLSASDFFRMASYGPATSFALDHMTGSIAPGRRADILLMRSLTDLSVVETIRVGRLAGYCPNADF